MVLNYYGYNIDKITLTNQFLLQCEIGTVSFSEAFVGNPTNENAYGCYSDVIEE